MRAVLIIALFFASLYCMGQMSYDFPSMEPMYVISENTLRSLKIQPTLNYKPRAQQTWWEKNKRPLAIAGSLAGGVILNAVGDGLLDEGKLRGDQSLMKWGHAVRATGYVLPIGGLAMTEPKKEEVPWILAEYFFFRVALFNPSYNLTRGLDVVYAGSTDVSDVLMSSIPPGGRAFIHVWSFGAAISINWTQFGWWGWK